MPAPLVSIITPVGPRHVTHVRTAAASVQWQSLSHLCEHVIACDGAAEVEKMPGNVTILPSDGEQRGPAHTRNRALAKARGVFTLPLDADDYLLKNTVAHMLRAYATGKHGYIYGDAFTREKDGTFVLRGAPDYNQDHMRRYNIHVVTALTPTKHWRAVGGWDEGVDAWEDWSGHLRLAIAGVCGYRMPLPVFVYRVHEGDRMTRFYGGAPELMERVTSRYKNAEGNIVMAGCCGGDAGLADIARSAIGTLNPPDAMPMEGGKVRVEYIGEEKGGITWQFGAGRVLGPLGNSPMNRYADMTQEEAAWLAERAPIRLVPRFDGPEPPTPLPIMRETDVLTPDAVRAKALRPRAR